MKKIVILFALTLMTFTANAQKPNGKTTQSSRPRTTQRSTQRKSSTTRQNTQNKAYSCPDNKHPHLIDLGLPSGTKWACCNLGANKPEDYGEYYAWMEMYVKEVYSHYNCRHYSIEDGKYKRVGKINTWWSRFIPNEDQFWELKKKCKYEWITVNGVSGGRFTGPNGRSIFLPAAGYRWDDNLGYAGSEGSYWTSTATEDPSRPFGFEIRSDEVCGSEAHVTCTGHPLRPVSR